MTEKATTYVLVGVVAVVFLATVYLLTKPKPQDDMSLDELGGLVATVAKLYYAAGA